MKTAIQELIEKYNEHLKFDDDLDSMSGRDILKVVIVDLLSYKVKEKEQIIEAWIVADNELQRTEAEKYYNITYKQDVFAREHAIKTPPNHSQQAFVGLKEWDSFCNAYTQCQEDMADKKYTEEDMRKCWDNGRKNKSIYQETLQLKMLCLEYSKDVKKLNDIINLLNKQINK